MGTIKEKIRSQKFILRVASIISFIWSIGHTYGTVSILNGSVKDDLTSQKIIIEGVSKTYAELFAGYGHFITVFMIMQAILLWMLASLANKGFPVKNFVLIFLFGSLATAALSQMYLIAIPMIFSIVIAALLSIVLLSGEKTSKV